MLRILDPLLLIFIQFSSLGEEKANFKVSCVNSCQDTLSLPQGNKVLRTRLRSSKHPRLTHTLSVLSAVLICDDALSLFFAKVSL